MTPNRALVVSNSRSFQYVEQEQRNEETFIAEDQPRSKHIYSGPGTHTEEDGERVITITIRATDNVLGIGRMPAGLYVMAHHSGFEWRTKNMLVTANNNAIGWDEPIPIWSDPSAIIYLAIHAFFEYHPMLGKGEQLRELMNAMEQLLDRSVKHLSLILFPVGGGVISPCLSLFVTVRRRQRIGSDSLAIPNLYSAATKSWDRLEDTINPGYNVLSRYRKCGEGWDLERTIEQFERALNVCPLDHLCRAAARSNLAMTDFTRCLVEGTGPFHDVSLGLYRDALTTRPIGNFGRPSTLIRLAVVHLARFEQRQDKIGAALAHETVNLSSVESHGHQAATLLLWLHASDKVDSIQACDQSFVKHDFPPSLTYVDPWTSSFQLLLRFKLLGDLADLQQAISILETIIKTVPLLDQRHPFGLEILGMAYRYRFDCLGELSDLEKAISKFGSVVDFLPDGDTLKPACLNNLGIAFRTRFERLGELSDLERAISRLENAVHLTQSNPEIADYLNNLGIAFGARFEHLGKLDDLEEAISRQRNAVDLTPHGHPHKPAVLNNLGTSFLTRFERLGELCDLEQGISRFRDAIDLTPDGHPDKPFRLNNIGNSFRTRFKHLGELSDLERAISRHREAVDLIPHGLRKPACLNNLGSSFFTRFEMLGKLDDLEQAISNLADAVDLIPRDHPDKRTYLNNLGVSLQTRFGRLRKLSDLDQAILMQMDAIDLTPDDHPDRPRYLGNLGNSFLSRFQHLDELSDLEQAISRYSRAACSAIGPTIDRFHASQAWISCARSPRHPSLLHAYSVSIGLLPKLAWIGLSLAHRYRELIRGADVVREAAATAVESGHLKIAVEWLEQGRSIVWGELLQLRGSYDELAGAYPDHARRLRELSTALEQASSTRERILSALSEHAQSSGHRVIESLQQEADRHRMLAIDRDKVLCNIREFPGFERFLLHTEFSQLRASAHSGPVVILNAAETRCDALVVLADAEDVIHVPFPNFSLRRSRGLQNALKNLLGPARIIRSDTRKGRPVSRTQINWEFLLAILWKGVVKPVLDALGFSSPGHLSRIFWCPTGPFAFLPIHAAGLYGTRFSAPGHKASDFVISSYIPTVGALAHPPRSDASSSGDLRFLSVRQPSTDGQSRLPGVDVELEHIEGIIRNSPSMRTALTESTVGTVEEVLALMRHADWVHFACHGVQDAANPTESGLCLADHCRLKLSDLISLTERPRGGLAFLSACQTAMGDENLSDEAIHIAAGMLFAGYGGVVGTMWSISDKLAPIVAKDVYEQLFRSGTTPDYREAARALHDAVGRLRDGGASFVEWLPFIHVGL